jgi:hypothetical protein
MRSRRAVFRRARRSYRPPGLSKLLTLSRQHADQSAVGRDVAPVIAAEVLLARGVREDMVFAYLASMWRLNDVDGRAAVAAAHVLLRRVRTAAPSPTNGE